MTRFERVRVSGELGQLHNRQVPIRQTSHFQ